MRESEEIIDNLKKNFRNNNLHHSLLFTFNDRKTKNYFLEDIKKNLKIIFDQNEISIDTELDNDVSKKNILNLIDKSYYKWTKQTPRIIFINNFDNLSLSSMNSLLKILEEPQDNTYFFLFSAFPSKIIDTVKSRCLIFNLVSKTGDDYIHLDFLNKNNIFLSIKNLLKIDKYELEQDLNLWYRDNYLLLSKSISERFLELINRFIIEKNYQQTLESILIIIWRVKYESFI